jgi:hypothetical protein
MSKNTNTASIMSMQLKPSDIKAAIRDISSTGKSVFIWGPPGVGKSQILKQLSQELGFDYFEDIRLSQMEPTDIRGIPMPVTLNGVDTVTWSAPDFYHNDTQDGKKRAFYLLDEMNSAPQSVQAAAYQIVLDRQIGKHKFGPNDVIIAAGNRETDKGATVKMPKPLENRFIHLEMKTDFEDWQTHAIETGFHPHVVGYLTFAKDKLFNFDPASASRAFPTPRSWEAVSSYLKSGPKASSEVQTSVIAGCVGDGLATQFMVYRKRAGELPNPTDILSGKVTDLRSKDIDVMYALVTSLCYELREIADRELAKGIEMRKSEVIQKAFSNFLSYCMKNFQAEIIILAVRISFTLHKIQVDHKKIGAWPQFSAEYGDLIMDA